MNKYNTLFFFLLKLKRVNYCLTLIWKELNGVEFRVSLVHKSKRVLFILFMCVENIPCRVPWTSKAPIPMVANVILPQNHWRICHGCCHLKLVEDSKDAACLDKLLWGADQSTQCLPRYYSRKVLLSTIKRQSTLDHSEPDLWIRFQTSLPRPQLRCWRLQGLPSEVRLVECV